MTIRTMIVDDEPLAREWLADLLSGEPDIEVVAQCENATKAVQAIDELRPDLIFMDIDLPEMDGFDVIQAIHVQPPPVCIFATAYDQHALRAFDANALDYIVKPFNHQRLSIAVRRAREYIQLRAPNIMMGQLDRILEEIKGTRRYIRRIPLRQGAGSVTFLPVAEIDRLEAADNYVILHAEKSRHIIRGTLSALESRLSPEQFTRIHKSMIVNVERVVGFETTKSGETAVVLRDGTKLNVGRSYRDRLERLASGTI
jgi:two-component system, LytTR family, response regulator